MTWESELTDAMPYLVPFFILSLNIYARKTLGQKAGDPGADMFLNMICLDFILLIENLGDKSKGGLSISFLIIHLVGWHFSLYISKSSPEIKLPLVGVRKIPDSVKNSIPPVLAVFFFMVLMQEILEGQL